MHLINTVTDELLEREALTPPPFGPGFKFLPHGTIRMEVWGTSFKDAGEYCEFRLLNEAGEVLQTRQVDGY